MKFRDIFKIIGSTLLSSHPVGAGILTAVNSFLPNDEKLPEGTTGSSVLNAVDKMDSKHKYALMEKHIDLEVKKEEGWTERYVAMTKADGQTTRPKIALMMAKVFCGCMLGYLIIIAYAVADEGFKVLDSPYVWQLFAVLTAVPAGVLGKYFGELRREQSNRLQSIGDLKMEKSLVNRLIGTFGGGHGIDPPPKDNPKDKPKEEIPTPDK